MAEKVLRKRAFDFLAELAEENRLQAILITDLLNIWYLSGFRGSEAVIIFSPEARWFLSDFRYQLQAEQEVSGFRVKIFRDKLKELRHLLERTPGARVGFEPTSLSYQFYSQLKKELKRVRLVPLKKSLSQIRAIKERDEIEKIENAVIIAEKALSRALKQFRAGIKERDFAMELEYQIRRAGGGGLGFETIVASGPRGALPHGKASDKLIKNGELVVIDFGANYEGYYSDLTVTVSAGEPSKRARELYHLVSEAQALARDAIQPGKKAKEIDQLARDYIKRNGYGAYFKHGLGHGLGLAVHEEPAINSKSETELKPGMVFTIEPGIYLPKKFGVRIEDDIILEHNKARSLSRSNQPLRVFE